MFDNLNNLNTFYIRKIKREEIAIKKIYSCPLSRKGEMRQRRIKMLMEKLSSELYRQREMKLVI